MRAQSLCMCNRMCFWEATCHSNNTFCVYVVALLRIIMTYTYIHIHIYSPVLIYMVLYITAYKHLRAHM